VQLVRNKALINWREYLPEELIWSQENMSTTTTTTTTAEKCGEKQTPCRRYSPCVTRAHQPAVDRQSMALTLPRDVVA